MKNKIAICVAHKNTEYLKEAYQILENGGSAVDAVVNAMTKVEDDPSINDTGFNGFPNLLGEAELDASIIIGNNKKSGAVAGVKNYKNPIKIAKEILERLPYDMLIGDGAEKFADFIGIKKDSKLIEDDIINVYKDFFNSKTFEIKDSDHEYVKHLKKDKFLKWSINNKSLFDFYDEYIQEHHGTMDVIAIDSKGFIASGVSTSGLAYKFPGRVSDSCRIGAGNYAEKYGAAGCTGAGELAVALNLAKYTTDLMISNNPEEATEKAIKHLINYTKENNIEGVMTILAMDINGNCFSCSNFKNDRSYYTYQSSDSNGPQVKEVKIVE